MTVQLAQSQTTAANVSRELYAPPTGYKARNLSLIVCETTNTDTVYKLYHDKDGAVRTAATQIRISTIAANTSDELRLRFEMSSDAHGLGIEAATTAVTFTLYGDELLAD